MGKKDKKSGKNGKGEFVPVPPRTDRSSLKGVATKKATDETPVSENRDEMPKAKTIEGKITKYIEKYETSSITGHYLGEMGVTSEMVYGLSSVSFGRYNLKRPHTTTDVWVIEDTAPADEE
jgi:hypothetical protein